MAGNLFSYNVIKSTLNIALNSAISTAQRRRGRGGKMGGRRGGMGRGRGGMGPGPGGPRPGGMGPGAGGPRPAAPSPMDEERESEEATLEGMYVHTVHITIARYMYID